MISLGKIISLKRRYGITSFLWATVKILKAFFRTFLNFYFSCRYRSLPLGQYKWINDWICHSMAVRHIHYLETSQPTNFHFFVRSLANWSSFSPYYTAWIIRLFVFYLSMLEVVCPPQKLVHMKNAKFSEIIFIENLFYIELKNICKLAFIRCNIGH